MAVELATAYISLVADTGDLAKSVKSGMSSVSSSAEDSGGSIGAALVKGVGAVALGGIVAVAGTAVGALGVAVTKGLGRLNSLDQATAKLDGLGHSAESVEAIMGNALASVRGTAFGMDEAAGVAAGVVAAGVKPGEQLERTLKLVADGATIAGSSMGEMGAIFNKVAGTGKIQGDVIAQLGDRGIPILQLLADEMGVTAAEVSEMASAGEIDFERFQNAMEAGMGGAALKSGETFKGAMANVQASMGRIGAGLVGGVFTELAPTLSALTSAMGPLESIAGDLGVALGEKLAPGFEALRGMLTGEIRPEWFSELAAGFSEMQYAFNEGINPDAVGLVGLMGQIGGTAGLVQGGFTQMFRAFTSGADEAQNTGIIGLFQSVGIALRQILETDIMSFLSPVGLAFKTLQPVLPLIADALSAVVLALSGGLSTALGVIVPVLGQLVTIASGLLADILPSLIPVITQIATVFGEVLTAVMPLVETLLIGLVPVLDMLFTAVTPIIQPFLDLLTPLLSLITTILPPLVELLSGVASVGLGMVQAAIMFLLPVVEGLANAFGSVLTPVIETLQGYLGGLVTFITGVFTLNWEQAWQGITDVFGSIFGGIADVGKGVINGIIDLINGFINGLNGFGDLVSDVTGGAVDFTIGTIPRLAQGATVQPRPGGTLAILAEAGRAESVVDTGLMNRALEQGLSGNNGLRGSNITIEINSQGKDEYLIAKETALQLASLVN